MASKTKRGRPSDYTEEIAAEICHRMSEGESLRRICRDEHLPNISTIIDWALGTVRAAKDANFPAQYRRAREIRSELYADEVVDISDTAKDRDSAAVAKVRVDARKWVAARLLPKTYGDKVNLEHTGPDGGPIESIQRVEMVIVDGADAPDDPD